jgi:O-antigen ligase
MLPLFNSNYRRNIGIHAYLITMAIVLIGVYLMFFEIILPIEYSIKGNKQSFTVDGGFASHVITNILMAFTMFIAAQRAVFTRILFKPAYFILFVASFYYVLFISTGTSGQILAVILLILFIVQHTGVRSVLFVPILFSLIVGTAIMNKNYLHLVGNNSSIQFAIDKFQVQYHHFISTDTAGNNTRPRIYFNTIKLIRDNPWIGTGVGSFEEALRIKQPDFYEATSIAKRNPHNEFLLITVQLGISGLFLLLYLFYAQGASTDKLIKREQKFIAQGLVVLIIIGCMGNSMLLDSREGHFWAFFSALLFSSLSRELE